MNKKRERYMKELSSAREQLSWDNFSSVPVEKHTALKKTYNTFISIIQEYVIT